MVDLDGLGWEILVVVVEDFRLLSFVIVRTVREDKVRKDKLRKIKAKVE